MQTEVPGRIWPFSLAQNLHHKAELLFFTKKLSAKFDVVIGSTQLLPAGTALVGFLLYEQTELNSCYFITNFST